MKNKKIICVLLPILIPAVALAALGVGQALAQSNIDDTYKYALSTNAGWQKMTSPTAVNLYDVWGSSYKDVFVVGFSTDIFHYNGENWSAKPSRTSSSFNAV